MNIYAREYTHFYKYTPSYKYEHIHSQIYIYVFVSIYIAKSSSKQVILILNQGMEASTSQSVSHC